MFEKIKNLIDVKSIVTILLTIVFSILIIARNNIPQEFLTIYTVIISFYFGTQYQKNANTIENKEGDKDEK